jgi:hypothetical protein
VRPVAVAAFLAVSALALDASASLGADVALLTRAATERGGKVEHAESVFLEEGRVRVLEVPSGSTAFCRTIFFVAARNIQLTAASVPASGDADTLWVRLATVGESGRVDSEGGLIELSACGERAADLGRVIVRMGSARGAVEIVSVASSSPLDGVAAVLARDPGPISPRIDPGPPLVPGTLLERRRRAEERSRAAGATNVLPLEMRAGRDGRGELTLKLPSGCHKLDVLADAGEASGHPVSPFDLDAELRVTDSGELLARDRGETPDAHLDTCVSKTTELAVSFQGAPPSARVVTLDSIWPIPKGIPSRWGPRAHGTLAAALRRRTSRPPSEPPFVEALGAQGTTVVPLEIEPGRCYVGAVALIRGVSRGIRISASAGGKASNEELPAPVDGGAVVFCAKNRQRATISIEAPGASLWWVLEVWTLGERSARSAEAEAP